MKKLILLSLCLGWILGLQAQKFELSEQSGKVRTNSFGSDWYLQMGLDMSLQNPYGYDFSDVFPNGKTFGLDVAVGKWFTPQVGIRGKFNWENGIPLFENHHANWLAPFYKPGVNMDKGGYIAFYGDFLLNLHNLFGSYKPARKWELSVYPRIGVDYNFGVSKGALLVAAGILNTYRLSNRWSLYCDMAYIMTGSGFVGAEKVEGTGTGSNSNGFLTIGLGAQLDLGKTEAADKNKSSHAVWTNGFWNNWFVQAGLDMSLLNPYGCNFSQVFPKGKTFGVNAAVGKWFTPEFALRGRLYWENGLIENKHLEWVPPVDHPEKNFDDHGFGAISLDAMLNLTNVIAGYQPEKKWHTSAFIRAGLITQFTNGSGSPLGGIGLEQTYRVSKRVSVFGALGYQVTTSEGMGVSTTGMDVAAGSNGFFDLDLGVVIDLGKNSWKKYE